MSYDIEWSQQSLKTIKKLPTKDADRILSKLDQVTQNPFRYLEHFERHGLFKLRIGDYRLLIDANTDRRLLYIQLFDKRGRVYKR